MGGLAARGLTLVGGGERGGPGDAMPLCAACRRLGVGVPQGAKGGRAENSEGSRRPGFCGTGGLDHEHRGHGGVEPTGGIEGTQNYRKNGGNSYLVTKVTTGQEKLSHGGSKSTRGAGSELRVLYASVVQNAAVIFFVPFRVFRGQFSGMNFSGKRLVVLGAGYVGGEIARQAAARGLRVTAITRNAETARALTAAGVEAVVADLAGDEWHARVAGGADFVLNSVGSGGGGLAHYRRSYVDGMCSALAWAARGGLAGGTLVWTSSTSVYPQGGGATVDETAAVGGNERADVLVEAENLALRAATEKNGDGAAPPARPVARGRGRATGARRASAESRAPRRHLRGNLGGIYCAADSSGRRIQRGRRRPGGQGRGRRVVGRATWCGGATFHW
jgi:hypothetical protein